MILYNFTGDSGSTPYLDPSTSMGDKTQEEGNHSTHSVASPLHYNVSTEPSPAECLYPIETLDTGVTTFLPTGLAPADFASGFVSWDDVERNSVESVLDSTQCDIMEIFPTDQMRAMWHWKPVQFHSSRSPDSINSVTPCSTSQNIDHSVVESMSPICHFSVTSSPKPEPFQTVGTNFPSSLNNLSYLGPSMTPRYQNMVAYRNLGEKHLELPDIPGQDYTKNNAAPTTGSQHAEVSTTCLSAAIVPDDLWNTDWFTHPGVTSPLDCQPLLHQDVDGVFPYHNPNYNVDGAEDEQLQSPNAHLTDFSAHNPLPLLQRTKISLEDAKALPNSTNTSLCHGSPQTCYEAKVSAATPQKILNVSSETYSGCQKRPLDVAFEGHHTDPDHSKSRSASKTPRRGSDEHDKERLLACPFQKFDPKSYQKCLKYELHRIKDVKQHINRCHTKPSNYCATCFLVFDTAEQRDEHTRTRRCSVQDIDSVQFAGITDIQRRQLTEKSDRKLDVYEQWFQMWSILFPKKRQPKSPYLGGFVEEMVPSLRDLWERKGPLIMARCSSDEIARENLSYAMAQLLDCLEGKEFHLEDMDR